MKTKNKIKSADLFTSTFFCVFSTLLGSKIRTTYILLENYTKFSDDFSCWFSGPGERLLPFGLLVILTVVSVS